MNPKRMKMNEETDENYKSDLQKQLFQAVIDGNVGVIQSLENLVRNSNEQDNKMKALVNTTNRTEETLLALACRNGSLEMVVYLVEHLKADVHQLAYMFETNREIYSQCKPLHAAVMSGNINVVRFLVEKTDVNVNAISADITECDLAEDESVLSNNFYQGENTPLHYAIFYLNGEPMEAIVSYLIQKGADISIRNTAGQIPYQLKPFYEHTACNFLVFLKELFQAVEEGNVDRCQRIEKLIIDSQGSYPFPFVSIVNSTNDKKESPLVVASFAGHLNVVRYLVKHCKVNVNKKAILSQTKFKYRLPVKPLHAAVMSGNVDLVKFLVEECQVDINSVSGAPDPFPSFNKYQSYNTSLHYAIYTEFNNPSDLNFLVVTYLVQNGADPFIKTGPGKFPWEMGLKIGEKEALRRLIKLGLDVNRQDESTLETLAHHHIDSPEIIQLLLTEGADFSLKDIKGRTPFVLSLTDCKMNITSGKAIFKHLHNSMSLKDKIAHLELLGALGIRRNTKAKNVSYCRMYWDQVVQLRLSSQPEEFPWKKDRDAWPDCIRVVFQEIPDIDVRIGKNENELKLQAALTTYRYFGPGSDEFREAIGNLAFDYFHASQYHRSFNLYMVLIKCGESIGSSLKYETIKSYDKLVDIFYNLALQLNSSPDVTFCLFSNAFTVFDALLNHLKHCPTYENQRLIAENWGGRVLSDCIIKLTYLFIATKKSEKKLSQIKRCLSEFIKFQELRDAVTGNDLLRKAFQLSSEPDERRVPWIVPVIRFILESGADPNLILNYDGDTALHVMARRNYQVWDSPLFVAFLESGASLYKMNKDKETVLDLLYEASPQKGSIFVHPLPRYFPTLKFLSARIICKEIPDYDSIAILPQEIVNFIKRQSD